MRYEEAYAKCAEYGQEHVFRHYNELNEAEKQALLDQVEQLDLSVIAEAAEGQQTRGVFTPLDVFKPAESPEETASFDRTGLQAIAEGKVAAVVLAGGMGTRLGSDNPKCMYDIGITKPVFIMQRLIENLRAVTDRIDSTPMVPFCIMTSDKNHEATVSFMQEHDNFGYPADLVFYFKQEMAPATGYDRKVLMEDKGVIASSPNGNGGWFISMKKAGLSDRLREMGVEWLNLFSVDNVLQRMADPVFVGGCIERGVVSGAKVVRKAFREEKVGTICLEDGHPSIVEYYDMTPELLDAVNDKGEPAYEYGVILNYLFRIDALEEIVGARLPLHVVEKKIPYMDENGEFIKPSEPNGYKYEQLILDMIHEMKDCLPMDVDREKEFAPIKNKEGVDSVESARELCRKNGIAL